MKGEGGEGLGKGSKEGNIEGEQCMGNLSTEGRLEGGEKATKRTNIFGDEIIDTRRQNEGKMCGLDIEGRKDGGKREQGR